MDNSCIQDILHGDIAAFRQLITKYKDMAYSIAMSIVKNEFYAEEVLQISFVKAFENLDSFKGDSKFSTWFYRIVVNESFKQLEKKKSEFINFVEEPPDISNEIDNSILKLIKTDQEYYINKALEKISPHESLILRLFYLDEKSTDEISNITGWTTVNIKVILHRARINFRVILTQIFKLDKKSLY
jgi:RNA polymerase sigma factor (sigma-70 family)